MIKKLILSIFLFATLFLPIHAFATAIYVSSGYGQNVDFNYNDNTAAGWAGWINASFSDPAFYSAAYCVDIGTDLTLNRTYEIEKFVAVSNYFDGIYSKGQALNAAWLMDEFSSSLGYSGYSDGEQAASEAGLQLAIWDALYEDTFSVLYGGDYKYTSTEAWGYYDDYISGLNSADLGDFTGENFKVALLKGGQDLVIYNPVPEPATMLLFGIGLLGLSAIGRKRS